MVDGGEDYDRGGSGNISIMPSIDAIAEFRAAQLQLQRGIRPFLRPATMTMVFKSGTKEFHASGMGVLPQRCPGRRNRYFINAAGNRATGVTVQHLRFQRRRPRIHSEGLQKNRDKTFFFYNMEWRKLIQGGVNNQTVPSTSEYGGQFSTGIHVPSASQISPALQAQYAALGLAPGSSFSRQQGFPVSLLDPNAQALLQAGSFLRRITEFSSSAGTKLPTKVREEIVRIDHRSAINSTIFGHWVDEQISQAYGNAQWSDDNVPTVGDVFGNPSYSGVIHATYSISPTLLNETAFNYNGNRINITPTGVYTRPVI